MKPVERMEDGSLYVFGVPLDALVEGDFRANLIRPDPSLPVRRFLRVGECVSLSLRSARTNFAQTRIVQVRRWVSGGFVELEDEFGAFWVYRQDGMLLPPWAAAARALKALLIDAGAEEYLKARFPEENDGDEGGSSAAEKTFRDARR